MSADFDPGYRLRLSLKFWALQVLLAESEGMIQRIVDEFGRVCRSRKLKVNAGQSKVIIFERTREQTIHFANEYDFTKRVYDSTIKGRVVRGRTPVKWIN